MRPPTRWKYIAISGIIVALAIFVWVQTQRLSKGPEISPPATPHADGSPSSGRVTMIDLGATECIPCKMMAPIIEDLQKESAGRADILFIDVWKNPGPAKKYGIRTIPTQIFFDQNGQEVQRHTGFMDKKRITDILRKLGVS